MNKKQKIKRLTWKYFFIRKFLEILIIPAFIFVPYWLGNLFLNTHCYLFDLCEPINYVIGVWFFGVFMTLISGMMLTLIFLLIYIIIEDNWKKSKKKANKVYAQLNKTGGKKHGI